jgi:hypothetical protein
MDANPQSATFGKIITQDELNALKLDDPIRAEDFIEVFGTEEQVHNVSRAVIADRRRRNKAARKARRKNR